MATNIRFPEPDRIQDEYLKEYLSELIRTLEDFDSRIFSQDTGVLFETARRRPFIEVSSNHTVGQYESMVLVDSDGGDIVVSCPLALDFKGTYIDVKKIDTNGATTVSIVGSGGDMPVTLSGANRPSVTLFSDGNNVWTING